MFLRQVADAPLIVSLGTEKLSVPRFTLGDFAVWGAILDHEKAERETSELNPGDRARYLKYEPIIPTTKGEMRHMVRTVRGVDHVCLTCFAKATVIERDGVRLPVPETLGNRAALILPTIHGEDREHLALILAGMAHEVEDAAGDATTDSTGAGADPLRSSPSGPTS
jgi:hypothetical protein